MLLLWQTAVPLELLASPAPERCEPLPQAAVQSPAPAAACPTPDGSPGTADLAFLGPLSAACGEPLPVAARLSDRCGNGVAGRPVSLSLGAETATATTGADGVARASFAPAAAGDLPLTLRFAGDAAHLPAESSTAVRILPLPTLVRFTGGPTLATGRSQALSARLLDARSGRPLAGMTLDFAAGPARASATTGADGTATASLALPPDGPTGPLAGTVSFAGDGCRAPAADAFMVTAYQPAPFVVWGGNLGGLRLGQRVNFWGHSWPRQVTSGDYGASGDFKGHAPGLAQWQVCQPRATTRSAPPLDASCWTSKPGQSFPPETLPDHIGVMVATSIGKERGTDFGNVAALAVVKVDPDPPYGPVPGKPGFGILVAVIGDGAGLFPEPRIEASQTQPAAVLPGQPFEVAVDLRNAAAAAAEAVTLSESFDGPLPPAASATLGTLAGGAEASQAFEVHAPPLLPRGADEPSLEYQRRLAAADDSLLPSYGRIDLRDGTGRTFPPVDLFSASRLTLPWLAPGIVAPACASPGTRPFTLRWSNLGSAPAAGGQAGLTLPDGTAAALPLGPLGPGESAESLLAWSVPPVPPKGTGETDADYLARLAAADGAPLALAADLSWTDGLGTGYGPVEARCATAVTIPVLSFEASASATLLPGERADLSAAVRNTGRGNALQAAFGAGARFDLAAGGSASVPLALAAPEVAPRSPAENDGAYRARLEEADESPVGEPLSLAWQDVAGNAYGPLGGRLASTRVLPIVPISLSGPATARPGDAFSYVVEVAGAGHAAASGVELELTLPDGSLRRLPSADLDPGSEESHRVDFTVPADQPAGEIVARAAVRWRDARGTAYGPLSAAVTTVVTAPEPEVFHQDGDLGGGDKVNLARDPYGHLHVIEEAAPFHFLWVAVSSRGTVVKIDTDTGAVVGEYRTSPAGQPKDPSRTTVDHNGNVWATNRAGNSVLRIGLLENGQCVDRNGNGVIDTSTKQGDIRAWTNAGGVDSDGGVATAADECILNYLRVSSSGTRHVSVTAANDVWVSGTGGRRFDLIDGRTGEIKRRETSVGYGGYGGLIDDKGVIWSARPLLRWDTALSLKGANGGNWKGYGHDSYGLCLDSKGNVWNTDFDSGVIRKFAPDGSLLGTFRHGASHAQGCAVDGNDHVWVAHSLYRSTVGHLLNDGTLVGSVQVGSGPTGVAVDALGKVWATNYNSRNVSRIDPLAGPIGADGVTPVGAVDFTTVDLKGHLYNYSDMTGSTLRGMPEGGTWSQVFDSGQAGAEWGVMVWSGSVCGDGELAVSAASSADGIAFSAPAAAVNGGELALPAGRYLRVDVRFRRAATGESPFLHSLSAGLRGWVPPAVPAPVVEVDAGLDRITTLPNAAGLAGRVCATGRVGGRLPIAWSKVSGPSDVAFARPSLPVTDATPAEPGEYVLRLAAGDVSDEVAVVALEANDPPAVEAGADRTIALPATLDLAGTVTDDGRPQASTLALSWSVVSGPADVTFADPAAATTASFTEPGSYRLRLAADDSNLVGLDELAVTVVPANDAPRVDAGPDRTVRLPARADLDGTAADDGRPAGSALRLAWSKVSGPGTVSFGTGTAADTTATFGAAGSYVLRLTGTDSQLSATDDVSVTVLPANQKPVVSAGPNLAVELPAAAELRGSASDDGVPEGAGLTFAWSKVSGPGFVAFAGPAAAGTSVTFSDPGSYVLRLTASDGALSASDDVAVTVRPSTVNLPPTVSAGPDQTVEHPAAATLRGQAGDDRLPAGSTLTLAWSKASGPGEVAFSAPAAVTTPVTFTAPGEYVLELAATDTELTSRDAVTVTVLPQNFPPAASAGPDRSTGIPGPPLALQGSATDDGLPAGGALTVAWTKVSGPGTVTFSDPAATATTAVFNAIGSYVLRLTASDSQRSASDDVAVTVVRANVAPSVDAGADLSLHLPNAASLKGVVRDDGLPAGQRVQVAWSQLEGPGAAVFARADAAATTATFSQAGTYRLRLTANDSQLEAADEVLVEVRPPLPPPPAVAIASPADGGEITGPFDVVGTVSHGTWKLEHAQGVPVGSPEPAVWTTIASGSTPVASGVLGTFDPTLLLNGTYIVRLTATDAEGQTVSVTRTAVVAGERKIGHFTLTFEDLSVPVAGLPIQVFRTYDSRDKRQGDFGIGWTLSLKNVRLEKSAVSGLFWRQSVFPGTLPQYCLQPTRPNTVTITFPDGRVYRFQATVTKQCQAVVPLTEARFGFAPMPGTRGSLVPEGPLDVLVEGGAPGPVELLNAADPRLNVYDPEVFRLTTDEGFVYVIDRKTGVRSVTDRNGNRLTVSADGVIHSSGKSIRFVRDAAGRIVQIIDPLGNAMSYAYDGNGDLVSYKDREGHETRFTYNDRHHLVDIFDPRGVQAVRNDYDEQGRLISHADAQGKTITYRRDLDARQELVTDRLGQAMLYEYDSRGKVLRITDPEGNVTSYTYDARGNRLTETDPLGNTTQLEYDAAANLIRRTDPLGNTVRYTYNARKQVLTTTDARGGVTSNTYDTRGNLISERDPLGNTVTYVVDRWGRVVSLTDPLEGVVRFEYDAAGNLTRIVDALGNAVDRELDANGNLLIRRERRTTRAGEVRELVGRYEYDRRGLLLRSSGPEGGETRTVYDPAGRATEKIDQLGRRTSWEYDLLGRLTKVVHKDGTNEEYEYDAEGRRVLHRDRAGRATSVTYDALGRPVRTLFPDGQWTATAYDPLGRVVATTDEIGSTTRFEYDPRCACPERLLRVIDAAEGITSHDYDASGNRISDTAPDGRTTRHEYDLNSRLVGILHADETRERLAYDALGRVIEKTDRAGNTLRIEYDQAGRPVGVTGPLGQSVRYRYDEIGNLVAQIDALERTTLYEHDDLGRRTRRALPLGMSETFQYDAVGNVIARTDFQGRETRYVYDGMNRLIEKIPTPGSGEPGVRITYNPSGTRATMEDASGLTSYSYDERDRLIARDTPQGRLTYSYDAAGRLVGTASSNAGGLSLRYTHDAAGRLTEIIDLGLSPNRVTSYSYGVGGTLESEVLPNQVRASYLFDGMGQLSRVTLEKAEPLAAFSYEHGVPGLTTAVTEPGGRRVEYSYDSLQRLIREAVMGPSRGEISYELDAAGNRLRRTSSMPAIPPIEHSYDPNDRLADASYNENGNPIVLGGEAHVYDFENRLVSAGDGRVRLVYDGDGNLVAREAGGVVTRYLVDTNNPTGFPQIVEEVVGGEVRVVYTYGLRPIGQRSRHGSGWIVRYYGRDGRGSVRLLLDENGAITDTFDYDAFGNLVGRTGTTPAVLGYLGERHDPDLNLIYLRARYLDPASGRFLTMDEWEGSRLAPLSLHKYLYAEADPVNKTDPSGRFSMVEKLSVNQILGVLVLLTLATVDSDRRIDFVRRRYAPRLTRRPAPPPDPEPESEPHRPIPRLDLDLEKHRPKRGLRRFGDGHGVFPPRIQGFNLRPGQTAEMTMDENGMVGLIGKEYPEGFYFEGASAWTDVKFAPFLGLYYSLPGGVPLTDESIAALADGRDMGGPFEPTHHSITPLEKMRPEDFVARFQALLWFIAGVKLFRAGPPHPRN